LPRNRRSATCTAPTTRITDATGAAYKQARKTTHDFASFARRPTVGQVCDRFDARLLHIHVHTPCLICFVTGGLELLSKENKETPVGHFNAHEGRATLWTFFATHTKCRD